MFQRTSGWLFMGLIAISISLLSSPVAGQEIEGPFFGPPGNVNTRPGMVDGTAHVTFLRWDNDSKFLLRLEGPWEECWDDNGIFPVKDGNKVIGGIHRGRQVILDPLSPTDDSLRSTYSEWSDQNHGHGELTKSNPSNDYYDQIHFWGRKSGSRTHNFNLTLPLVQQESGEVQYIGIANIQNLAPIPACGNVPSNPQIWIPMGTVDGHPTVILDIDGDGNPDTEDFLQPYGPHVQGGAAPVTTTPIPTLSEWGMIGITVIFLLLGLRYLRKRGFLAQT